MASTLQLQAIALAVLLSLLAPVTPASAQRQPPPVGVARPGCRDRCGNITIPYPFGIGAGCYRHDVLGGFQLLCDDTRSPPRLTISDYSSIELAGLSLAAGEARAYLNATRKCYNATGGFVDRNTNPSDMVLGTSPYLFSPVKNRLVATGCPSLGYFVDGREYFVSGCTSVCRPPQYTITGQGSCTGVGCCQSDIPPGVDYFQPNTLSLQQAELDPAFTNNVVISRCHYVFLVETAWFSYSDRAFLNRTARRARLGRPERRQLQRRQAQRHGLRVPERQQQVLRQHQQRRRLPVQMLQGVRGKPLPRRWMHRHRRVPPQRQLSMLRRLHKYAGKLHLRLPSGNQRRRHQAERLPDKGPSSR